MFSSVLAAKHNLVSFLSGLMIPPTTKEAVYSGYILSPDDLKSFMHSLESLVGGFDDNDSMDNYVLAYDSWRRHIPKTDKSKVPKLRFTYKPGATTELDFDDAVEMAFFPVRWTSYQNDEEMERDRSLHEPNEADKVKFDKFAKYVASFGGKLPELSKLGFGCIKDEHPSCAWGDW